MSLNYDNEYGNTRNNEFSNEYGAEYYNEYIQYYQPINKPNTTQSIRRKRKLDGTFVYRINTRFDSNYPRNDVYLPNEIFRYWLNRIQLQSK